MLSPESCLHNAGWCKKCWNTHSMATWYFPILLFLCQESHIYCPETLAISIWYYLRPHISSLASIFVKCILFCKRQSANIFIRLRAQTSGYVYRYNCSVLVAPHEVRDPQEVKSDVYCSSKPFLHFSDYTFKQFFKSWCFKIWSMVLSHSKSFVKCHLF